MKNVNLKSQLQRLVARYGLDEVRREMKEMLSIETGPRPKNQRRSTRNAGTRSKVKPRKSRPTVTEYVVRMNLSPDRRAPTVALAGRFEDKSFLPTYADIRNFCLIYGIEVPASKARASAIPRIFKFIATMEASDIQRILDDNAFSGPARLAPLAEAIRRNGRAARHAKLGAGSSPKT